MVPMRISTRRKIAGEILGLMGEICIKEFYWSGANALTFPVPTGKLRNFNDFARLFGCLPKTLTGGYLEHSSWNGHHKTRNVH